MVEEEGNMGGGMIHDGVTRNKIKHTWRHTARQTDTQSSAINAYKSRWLKENKTCRMQTSWYKNRQRNKSEISYVMYSLAWNCLENVVVVRD